MIRHWLWLLVLGLYLMPLPISAESLPKAQRDLFMAFARDVSGDDSALMSAARKLVETPPITLEGIGFYSQEAAPAAERSLRGIISRLTDQGYLISNEDKYIHYLFKTLMEANLADPGDEADLFDLSVFFNKVDWDNGERPDWAAFKELFPHHTAALERAVVRKGFVLLSVRVPLGDTLYFWAAPPEVAKRWQNVALYAGVNTQKYAREPFVTFTVTQPDWQSYWLFLTYALDIPKEHRAMP